MVVPLTCMIQGKESGSSWQLDIPLNQIVAVDDNLFSSGEDYLNAWKGYYIEEYAR